MEFKYALIIILYLPIALYGLLNSLADYKMGKISYFVSLLRFGFWSVVILLSFSASWVVDQAITRGYTGEDFLTNYDVLTMFFVLVLSLLFVKLYGESKAIKRRFNLLHEEVAISGLLDIGGKKSKQ